MAGRDWAQQALRLPLEGVEVSAFKDLEAVKVTLEETKPSPAPVEGKKPSAEPAATAAANTQTPVPSDMAAATIIPSGQGTRVAMFSARFDKGEMEKKLRLDCAIFKKGFVHLCLYMLTLF